MNIVSLLNFYTNTNDNTNYPTDNIAIIYKNDKFLINIFGQSSINQIKISISIIEKDLDTKIYDISSFASKSYERDIYHASMEFNNFRGYKFIYDYNSFIINMVFYETHKNLEVLYKYLPELLDIDLKNREE